MADPAQGPMGSGPRGPASRQAPNTSGILNIIDQTVQDPERAKKVKTLVQQMVDESRATQLESRQQYLELRQRILDYDATPEQLDKAMEALNRRHAESARRFLEFRAKVKEALTAEEWKALAGRVVTGHWTPPGVLR